MTKQFVLVLCLAASALLAHASCPNSCSNSGTCIADTCVCFDGFDGPACDVVTSNCPASCSGHGKCLDGVCDCEVGFTGSDCSFVSSACAHLFNCTAHGVCVGGACECNEGWEGASCDVYTGYRCPASLNNCTDHGECGAWLGSGANWTCKCDLGFTGPRCDRVSSACPRNCTGHGVCTTQGTCNCLPGFTGEDCATATETPGCPNYCTGRGVCENFACKCDDGWSGSDCSTIAPQSEVCPQNCNGHGSCSSGHCQCLSGFTGLACESMVTCPNNCSAQGTCDVDGTCKCANGFTGTDCSLACSTGGSTQGCSARGKCLMDNNLPKCFCEAGYTGEGCENMEQTKDADVVGTSSPVGIVLACVVVVLFLTLFVGMGYQYMKGKRGLKALPGYSYVQTKTNDEFAYTSIGQ